MPKGMKPTTSAKANKGPKRVKVGAAVPVKRQTAKRMTKGESIASTGAGYAKARK